MLLNAAVIVTPSCKNAGGLVSQCIITAIRGIALKAPTFRPSNSSAQMKGVISELACSVVKPNWCPVNKFAAQSRLIGDAAGFRCLIAEKPMVPSHETSSIFRAKCRHKMERFYATRPKIPTSIVGPQSQVELVPQKPLPALNTLDRKDACC